jgi:undecaprenyl-diphosphatase
MTYLQALIIAIVEGITEFLPVSSTGHMMIATAMLGMESSDFVKLYTVSIQLGAILSVMVLYFRYFVVSVRFYMKLAVAFIPCAVAGVLFGDLIDGLLESHLTVAIALFAGGIVLLFVDRWFGTPVKTAEPDITFRDALGIGLFQCLALVPGVSRSAATIIGGLARKLNRQAAAEFSFLLAVPTMFAATAKKLFDFYNEGHSVSGEQMKLLAFGNVVAFIVAMIAIKTFLSLLNRHGFRWFGVYRIIVGGVLLALLLAGRDIAVV